MSSALKKSVLLLITALFAVVIPVMGLAAETGESFSFVIFSDCHLPCYLFHLGQPLDDLTLLGMHNQKRLRDFTDECLAMNPKPDFIMNNGDTGDLGWTNLLSLFQKLMRPLVDAGMPVYTVVGNHDLDYTGISRKDLAEFYDPLGPAMIGRSGTRYSFEHKGCHFIVMNNRPISGLLRFNPTDIAWLKDDLKKIRKDTRILLFMHANLTEFDTHNVVEALQDFSNAVIFLGHKHSDTFERWGGIPVVLTGALYGGTPETGSYRVITVHPEKIMVKTRDFANPAVTFNSETVVEFLAPCPKISILSPKKNAFADKEINLSAAVKPTVTGTLSYRIPNGGQWTAMNNTGGKWEASIALPETPGHYLVELEFKGTDGATGWAHTIVKKTGNVVREAWATDIGSAVQGAPVVWQDRIIVPTMERGIFALRLSDGKQLWRRDLDKEQVIGRIVADGDVVYFGAGREVFALDAKSGNILWKTPVKGTVVADITFADGHLFVPAGEHALVSLDAKNGAFRWEYAMKHPILMEPVVADGVVYIGAMDGYCRALDARTGLEKWNRQLSSMDDVYTSAPYWPPVSFGDVVIATKRPTDITPDNIIALSKADGSVRWSGKMNGWPSRLIPTRDGNAFYTIYSEARKRGVQCVSAKDGAIIWQKEIPTALYAGVLAGNALVVRDDMTVSCVDAATGNLKWTYRTAVGPQGSLFGPPAFTVKGTTAYIGTMDGNVLALQW